MIHLDLFLALTLFLSVSSILSGDDYHCDSLSVSQCVVFWCKVADNQCVYDACLNTIAPNDDSGFDCGAGCKYQQISFSDPDSGYTEVEGYCVAHERIVDSCMQLQSPLDDLDSMTMSEYCAQFDCHGWSNIGHWINGLGVFGACKISGGGPDPGENYHCDSLSVSQCVIFWCKVADNQCVYDLCLETSAPDDVSSFDCGTGCKYQQITHRSPNSDYTEVEGYCVTDERIVDFCMWLSAPLGELDSMTMTEWCAQYDCHGWSNIGPLNDDEGDFGACKISGGGPDPTQNSHTFLIHVPTVVLLSAALLMMLLV